MSKAVIALIHVYRYVLSPSLGSACRFTPTCSEYAISAISRYGPAKGIGLSARRVLRCHPWHRGGDDPLP